MYKRQPMATLPVVDGVFTARTQKAVDLLGRAPGNIRTVGVGVNIVQRLGGDGGPGRHQRPGDMQVKGQVVLPAQGARPLLVAIGCAQLLQEPEPKFRRADHIPQALVQARTLAHTPAHKAEASAASAARGADGADGKALVIGRGAQRHLARPGAARGHQLLRIYIIGGAKVIRHPAVPPGPQDVYKRQVIDRTGAVLADSDAVAGEMENHLTRPEVQQALQTGQGADLRFSETVRHTFLYVATATPDGSRIVRLAILMDELRRTENAILLWTALSCVLGLVVAVLLSIPLGSHFIAPIARLRKATRAIADGEYDHRAPAEADEIGLLAQDFNGMAAQLQRVIEHERLQNAQLDSILQSTPAGIIAIDQGGGILLINREAQRIFALHQLPPLHAPLNDWVRRPEVAQMMHETLSQGRPDSREYEIGEKALALYTAPIFTQEGAPATGAVLVCEDITALKKLEQMRTEFVSNVTHELKTPLTSIRGTIETLRTIRPMDEQLQEEMLEIMDLQSERLQALIRCV